MPRWPPAFPSFCHIAAASSPLKLWDERLRCCAAETGMRSKDKRTGVKIQNNDEYLKKCLGFGQNPQILAAVPQTAERSCNHRRPRRLNSSPTSAQAPSTLNLLKSCSISDTIQYYLRGAQQSMAPMAKRLAPTEGTARFSNSRHLLYTL